MAQHAVIPFRGAVYNRNDRIAAVGPLRVVRKIFFAHDVLLGGFIPDVEEDFLKDVKWIDLLKLKVSYGSVGNDQLDTTPHANQIGEYYYYWADRYTPSYNEETGQFSVTMSQKGNENLTWETHNDWNVGVDFGFFKNRLTGTIEYYNQKTVDLLWSKSLPLSSGLSVSS